jgi:hypothetical protein
MSINSVVPGFSLQTNPIPQTSPSPGFWGARSTQHGFAGMTAAETTRVSMRLLSIATGIGAFGAAATALLGMVSWPIGLLAVPLALGSAGALWYSFQFNDYENPEELVKFRHEAGPLSFEQVMQTHGWNNVLRWGILNVEQFSDKYRQHMRGKNLVEIINAHENAQRHLSQCPYPRYEYQLPSPAEWRAKWRSETAAKSFEEILQSYPLKKLESFNLVETGEMHKIKDLKRIYDEVKENFDSASARIEKEFQANTAVFQREQQCDSALIEAEYDNNWAVKRLQAFELDYVRERQTVQDTASRRKNEAKERFETAIAPITKNGKIAYNKLPPNDKALYDQRNNELQVSISQADNDARLQIAAIDARCITEKTRLNVEKVRVEALRDEKLAAAKNRYDISVVYHRQYKERQMAPVTATFKSIVDDLNGRYRAYLRTIGVAH